MTHSLSILALVSQLVASPAPDTASMQKPTEIEHGSAQGQAVVEGLAGVLADTLTPLDRRRLGRKVLSASRVAIIEGTFVGGGTRVVAVNVNLRMKDPDAVQQYIGGVFVVDDAGTLVATIVSPRMRPEHFAFEKIGDIDGDGSDDFTYASTSGEVSTRHRVTWDGVEPRTTQLGDSES